MSNLPARTPSAGSAHALPVVVIGGGPIGLVAAAHLIAAGDRPLLLEAGRSVGTNVREWGHVRLFSPWKYLVDPVAAAFLESRGWDRPNDEHLPSGKEFVEGFLEPLGEHPAIRAHLRFRQTVIGVSRKSIDKMRSLGREDAPFEVVARGPNGVIERHLARAVIDASGTWTTPNPLGAAGLPVEGEREHEERIRYGLPNILGKERRRYAGRTTLVVGSGHSAFHVILDLMRLAESAPDTKVLWAVRREDPGHMFGGGTRDALPARGDLGARLQALVDGGRVAFATGFQTDAVEADPDGRLRVRSTEGRVLGPVDRIISTTGSRPDLTILRELRLELDPGLEAPARLARIIDPNLHSCGTVYPHGYEELKHPERDLFVVGMKSYGRAPTFLMLTGYEQVRSVVAGLTGDLEAAHDVRLELPETGVCSTDLPDTGCCRSAEYEAHPLAGSCGVSSACKSEAALVTGSVSTAPRAGGCCG